MTLLFENNDITKMHVDAIVNAANNTLLGGSGVDGAIHFAAGPELLEECRTLGGCETGMAKITKGYKLPAKYVIHTVGPIYVDGKHNEKELLSSCYKNSLAIAKEKGLKSIAFPLISSGVFGYPKCEAFDVAVNSIKEFFTGENANCDMVVTIVLFGKETISINKEKVNDLKEYIDDNYVQLQKHNIQRDRFGGVISGNVLSNKFIGRVNSDERIINKVKEVNNKIEKNNINLDFENAYYSEISLEDRIKNIDASFSESLFKIIDSKKLKDVDVYNKANMDRKLFSKIRSGKHPSKITAIALCIALELNIKETDNLLKKAGYALSDSEYFDIIIKYHIKNKIYDVTEINKSLFNYDQQLLGVA